MKKHHKSGAFLSYKKENDRGLLTTSPDVKTACQRHSELREYEGKEDASQTMKKNLP
ncbi:hypothetical protein ABEV55_07415 [Aneurinibacillus thermoaerophilus]|uniref:hypothetical protein n=1 Tax=Aneurinibacillus thermoaerophilus TaxID=143495 RepID=UPI002E21FCE7|nr:hypothetical protein [Aneurinibacillus thermoaerophilus]